MCHIIGCFWGVLLITEKKNNIEDNWLDIYKISSEKD